jgi:tRNA G46 methylase TrmB
MSKCEPQPKVHIKKDSRVLSATMMLLLCHCEQASEKALDNCHFVSCNANVDLDAILQHVSDHSGTLARVSIQFPDPHFKNRNHKKRVLKV